MTVEKEKNRECMKQKESVRENGKRKRIWREERRKETNDKKQKIIWNGKASETRTHPSDWVSIFLVKCLKVIFALGYQPSFFLLTIYVSLLLIVELIRIRATIFHSKKNMPGNMRFQWSFSFSNFLFFFSFHFNFMFRWTFTQCFMRRLWRSIIWKTLRNLQLRW